MRILITRPREAGRATAAAVVALGHEAVLSPLLDIAATQNPWPPGAMDALVATSAQAFVHLADRPAWPLPEVRRLLPLFLVGERTAVAALAKGFSGPTLVAADAVELALEMKTRLVAPRRVIYLAGHDRKAEIEDSLAATGHDVALLEVYNAEAVEQLTAEALSLLGDKRIDCVLHYSRRSAEVFVSRAVVAGLDIVNMTHVCISASAAEPIFAVGCEQVLIATDATEAAMLAVLAPRSPL